MKKAVLILAVLSLWHFSCSKNSELKERTESLKPVVNHVKYIDPLNEDYSDLQFLKKILDDDSVKVVMLGEATHGDGSTSLAKSRLIKFLHKECGFDVLAWESGLFDCTSGWEQIQQNKKYYEELRRAVFALWVGTSQSEALQDYLQSTLQTPRPLELSGFDTQITGKDKNCEELLKQLKAAIPGILNGDDEKLFTKLTCLDEEVKTGGNDKNLELLNKICAMIDTLAAKDSNQEYWKNVLHGIRINYKGVVPQSETHEEFYTDMNDRDIQMGSNLLWLLNNKYKNRKVIVWGASFHNARSFGSLTAKDDSLKYINDVFKKTVTMGDVVYKQMGKKMYSIVFTSFKGNSRKVNDRSREKIDAPSELSIENVLNEIGQEYSFINLRNGQNPQWMKDGFISRPLGYTEVKGKWNESADGIFYIEEMKPSTWIHSQ